MSKDYILFVYNNYYPGGGMRDLYYRSGNVAKFSTVEEASAIGMLYDQFQVVNCNTFDVVYSTENSDPVYHD